MKSPSRLLRIEATLRDDEIRIDFTDRMPGGTPTAHRVEIDKEGQLLDLGGPEKISPKREELVWRIAAELMS